MAYSTIIKKKCKCGCNRWPSTGFGGYFYSHAPENIKLAQGLKAKKSYQIKLKRQKDSILRRKLHEVGKSSENKLSGNLEAVMSSQVQKDDWFDERMGRCEPICENCGKRGDFLKMPEFKILWRACQAHLLPKRHFKSIATHPLNGMVLGAGFTNLCNCHDTYDSSWEKAAKMKIWDEVVRRFLIMYPLIPQSEYQYIPPQLEQEINQI